jgi:hypothetical protein
MSLAKAKGKVMNLENFASKYIRELRQNSNLSTEYIDESMRPFLQPDTPEMIAATTLDSPLPKYKLLHELDLQDTLPLFNSILIYRILKKTYDSRPDIVGVIISRKATNKNITEDEIIGCGASDWSYSMRINDSLTAEIRSMFNNTRLKLRFWSCCTLDDENAKKEYGRSMADFFNDFNEILENNLHLFEEKALKSKHHKSTVLNIFAEKYKAAETLLLFADTFDLKPQKVQLKFEENPEVLSTGAIYLSSAIFFIIALESLVNTLYSLLIKKEFDSRDYERITIKSDLDLRLLTMHLFCNGFKSQIISPQTELWNNMLKLREFRNTVIHGNITDDDKVHAIIEDHIMFFYGPTRDYRGKSAEKKAENRFPVTMPQITKKVVLTIKEIVDEIVKSIITAMDDETRNWVEGWIKKLVILQDHCNRS